MAEQAFIAEGKNLEREYLTYAYKQARDGSFTPNIPDGNDHLIDALRYVWYFYYRNNEIAAAIDAALKEYDR